MTLIKLSDMLGGVKTSMNNIIGSVVQGHNELSENIADHPLIQIWPGGGGMGDPNQFTGINTSFRGAARVIQHIIYADLYVSQRTFIGQNMQSLVTYIESIIEELDNQTSPAFGVEGVRLGHWSWAYFAEKYANEEQIGARFALTLLTY